MGRMKISGPRNVTHVASAFGPVGDSTKRQWILGGDGHVYVEENGEVDESGYGIYPQVKTREMYLAGLGNEWKIDTLHIHHGAGISGSTTDIDTWYSISKTNVAPVTLPKQNTFTIENRGLSRIKPQVQGEGISLIFISDPNPTKRLMLNYTLIDSPTLLGEENSGGL